MKNLLFCEFNSENIDIGVIYVNAKKACTLDTGKASRKGVDKENERNNTDEGTVEC